MNDARPAVPGTPAQAFPAGVPPTGVGAAQRGPDEDLPRWLREAFERRGLTPHDGLPPAHHLLTERDLPCSEYEDERLSTHTAHYALISDLWMPLAERYRDRPDVFVAAHLFVYYDASAPNRRSAARTSPDLLVAFGAPKRERGSFVVWEEGKTPDFVLEVVSPSNGLQDAHDKPGLYQRMGVREYFLFDLRTRTEPRLRAWRLTRKAATPLPLVEVADGEVGVRSEVLGLDLCYTAPWPLVDHHLPEAGQARWHDPGSPRLLETADEVYRRAAEARAAVAEARAAAAEARAAAAEARFAAEASARRALEARLSALEASVRR